MSDKQWFDHIADGQPRQAMTDKQIAGAKRALNFLLSQARSGASRIITQSDLDEAHAAVCQALERQRVPEGWKRVPWQPTEDQWGGLARTLMMWIDMSGRPTGTALYRHLCNMRIEPPQWLLDEIPDTDHVPPKGTRAAVIYKAMLSAAPEPDDYP